MLQNFDIGLFFDPRGPNFVFAFIILGVIAIMASKSWKLGFTIILLGFIVSFSTNVYYRFAQGDVFTEIFDPRGANFTPAFILIGVVVFCFKKFGVGVLIIVVGVIIPEIVKQYDNMLGNLYRMSLIQHDLLFHQIYVWLPVVFVGGMILSGIFLMFIKQKKKIAGIIFLGDMFISAIIWISYYVELGFYEKLGTIKEVQIIEGEILVIISSIVFCFISKSMRKTNRDAKTSEGNLIHAQSAQKRTLAIAISLTAHIGASYLMGDITVTIIVPVTIIIVYIINWEQDIWENLKDSLLTVISSAKELLTGRAKNLEIYDENEIEGIYENNEIKNINKNYRINNNYGIGKFDEIKQLNQNSNRIGKSFREEYAKLEKSYIQRRLHANNSIKFNDKKVVSPRLQDNTIKFGDKKIVSPPPHANNTVKFDERKVNSSKIEPINQSDPLSAYNTLRSQLKNEIIGLINRRNLGVDLSDNDLNTVISKGRTFLLSKGIKIENNIQFKIQKLILIHDITRKSGSITKNTYDNAKSLITEINREFKNKFLKIKWKMDSKMNGKTKNKTNKLNQTVKEDDFGS